MDDKSAVKAKGLWEDWHMRQLSEQAGRINHRSGTLVTIVCGHNGGVSGGAPPVLLGSTLMSDLRYDNF